MTTQAEQKPALDVKLVNAVVDSTIEVLGTMAGTTATLKEIAPQQDYKPSGDISGIIGIAGDSGEGMVAISFQVKTAALIVSRLLGEKPDTLSAEDRCDGIGELLNMISGKAKSTLSAVGSEPYKLSLPTIIQGKDHAVGSRPKQCPYLVVEFEAEGDIFSLQVAFKNRTTL